MTTSGGGQGGGIIGDGSLIDEVNGQKNLLSVANQGRFEIVYNKYQADENSLSEADILFVLDCGKAIVRDLNA